MYLNKTPDEEYCFKEMLEVQQQKTVFHDEL